VTAGIFLVLNAVFSFVIWPPFYRRIAADPRAHDAAGAGTRFLRVHSVLIGTALLLAVVSLVVGVLTLVRVL
jgi:hypothetical protein